MASDYPNILQIAPIPTGSTKLLHTRLQGIISSLTELGYDSVICTYAEAKTVHGAENLRPPPHKKNLRTNIELQKHALSANFKLLWLSIKTYRAIDPVAIHAYGFRGMTIAALVKLLFFTKHTPIICDLSASDAEKLSTLSVYTPKGILVRLASLVTSPTQEALTTIKKTLKLSPTQVSIVVNGVDSSPFLDKQKRSAIREKLKLSSKKTIVVMNDSLEKSTHLDDLKRTILSCKDMQEEIHFLVIGNPKKYMYAFLKKYNLRKMCTLVGEVNKKLLPQYYAVSDIALTPSYLHEDEDRIKLLTFMANQLPVVAYDGKNQQQYLPDDTPLSHSSKEIIRQVKDLHHNKQWQHRLGEMNLQRFEEFYSWEVSKEQLYATYAQALS